MQHIEAIPGVDEKGEATLTPARYVPSAFAWIPSSDGTGWDVYEQYPDGTRDQLPAEEPA